MPRVISHFFIGYALNSKAYKVFNKTSLIVEESIHIVFDETNVASRKVVVDDVDIEELKIQEPSLEDLQRKEDQHEALPKTWKFIKDHPIDQVIKDPIQGMRTRGALKETCEYAAYISQMEPKNFKEVEHEESWIMAMQEKLGQFERNKV